MSRLRKTGVLVVVLALALTLGANLAWGDTPSGPKAYGMTYGEWGAAWWQWITASTFSKHPLLDTTGKWAKVNQMEKGFVFFLAGTWTGGPVVRNVTVPAGKAFFFPIYNWVKSYPEDVPADIPPSEAAAEQWMRDLLNETFDPLGPENFMCVVDGKERPELIFRAQSPAFSMYFPADCYEVIKDISGQGLPYQPGFHYPSVSDGFWAMVPPLDVGQHTIQILAGPSGDWQNVTYNLTIQ